MICPCLKADLSIFDAERVFDLVTFKEPQVLTAGIETVYVNGAKVWDGAKVTGELPGKVLRKNGSAK
ncbi:MAG: hypothetical protein HY231_11755 [Acidobacteria bacterium]|nr:hypothetical protein [Acidobacteriota bacterium]